MKNLFKKIAAVVSVAALSLSMAAFPVSADEVSTDEYQLKFYNADGSINMTGVNKLIDDQNNFYKEVLKNNRSSVDSVNVNNSTFFYYASNPVYVENMKNFINDRFETVYEDGHYYLILDGEKVEYYFGDNKFYYNRASYVIPSSRCSVDPNLASDYDTLSYIQKYDLWNTVSMYRKESIVYEMAIMPNAYDFSVNLYKFSSDD
jgi:phage pi2 protein 07